MTANRLIKLINYGAAALILILVCVAVNVLSHDALWVYVRHML